MTERTLILDPERIHRMLERMAWQILERHGSEESVILVGVSKSGFRLAQLLQARIQAISPSPIALAEISVNKRSPASGPTECSLRPSEFEGKNIVVILPSAAERYLSSALFQGQFSDAENVQ